MLRAPLVLVLGAAFACNSDDHGTLPEGSSSGSSGSTGEPSSSSSSSTGTPTTSGGESSTGDPSTGAPEQHCRDVLSCFSACALTLDPACFQGCTDGLSPEEGAKALALGACVVQGCFGSGACTVDTLQEPLCLACIGFGLLSDMTPGCEAQAADCN